MKNLSNCKCFQRIITITAILAFTGFQDKDLTAQTNSSFQLSTVPASNTGRDMKFNPTTKFLGLGLNSTTLNPQQRLHLNDGNFLLTKSVRDNGINGSILFGENQYSDNFGIWGIRYYTFEEIGGLNFFKPESHTGSPIDYVLFLDNKGNVGVGTNRPQAKFHVQGSAFITSSVLIGDGLKESILKVEGSIISSSLITDGDNKMVVSDKEGRLKIESIPTGDNWDHIARKNIQLNEFAISRDGSNNGIYISTLSKVGIGTNSPEKTLDINGDLQVKGLITGTNDASFSNLSIIGSERPNSAKIEIGNGDGETKESIRLYTKGESSSYDFLINDAHKFQILDKSIIAGDPADYLTFNFNVNGTVNANEVKVSLDHWNYWPDYVFSKDYKIISLYDLENYIFTNKHLPEIPSASQTLEEGIKIGEMSTLLLKKVEELTIYIIKQQHQIDEQNKLIEQLMNK